MAANGSVAVLLFAAGPAFQEETPHPHLGSYELSGEAAIGWRTLDVDGNDAQFDEDQNLERGLFLRDLSMTGKGLEGGSGPESFSLRAFGLGTPSSNLRAETAYGGVDMVARYARTSFTGTTDSDIHAFDFERESGSLGFERDAESGTVRRAGVEFSWLRRDGFTQGTRSVDNGFV